MTDRYPAAAEELRDASANYARAKRSRRGIPAAAKRLDRAFDAYIRAAEARGYVTRAGQARTRRARFAGQYRLNLAAERQRRIADAKHQPRTPVTRQRFWFKAIRRKPVRRRPLDAEARRYYEERDYELEQSVDGLKIAIGHIRDELASDVYDQGKKVDYRHAMKGRAAFTPTGRRVTGRIDAGSRAAETAARERIRELNDELRQVREERKSITEVMRYGELPGHYRKRLAAAPTRRRRR
jgi:hypothetical protein